MQPVLFFSSKFLVYSKPQTLNPELKANTYPFDSLGAKEMACTAAGVRLQQSEALGLQGAWAAPLRAAALTWKHVLVLLRDTMPVLADTVTCGTEEEDW